MLYQIYETQRSLLEPFADMADAVAKLYGNRHTLLGQLPMSQRVSAAYALWLYRRVVFGDLVKEALRSISDMTGRERAIFAPLVVMTLLLGVYPSLVTDIIGPSVEALITDYHAALPVTDSVAEAAAH